jgi:transcriptional regulator with XRE-family HTH domain
MARRLVREQDRNFAKEFGANLARLRRRAGVSQETLGFQSDVHRVAIGNMERGKQIPRADTAAKLCVGLGVSPDELFDGLSWKPPVLIKARPLFGGSARDGS